MPVNSYQKEHRLSAIAPTATVQRSQVQLEEEAENLSSGVLVLSLVVVHDSVGGRQDEVSELPGGKDHVSPAFNVAQLNIKPRRNHTALVDSPEQLNDDFSTSVVVDDFEFSDVSSLLHQLEELDEHFRARSQKHLTLAFLLSVQDVLECDCQDVALHVKSLY